MTKVQIKNALKERGWTQAQLAEKLKIHPGTLKNILSGPNTLTPTLAAHIELLLKDTQEQLIMYRVTFPDATCESWVPGWERLTAEQRQAAVGAVIEEAARQLMAEGAAAMTPEEQEHLRRFCGELRGPARVFEFKAEYGESMEPFA